MTRCCTVLPTMDVVGGVLSVDIYIYICTYIYFAADDIFGVTFFFACVCVGWSVVGCLSSFFIPLVYFAIFGTGRLPCVCVCVLGEGCFVVEKGEMNSRACTLVCIHLLIPSLFFPCDGCSTLSGAFSRSTTTFKTCRRTTKAKGKMRKAPCKHEGAFFGTTLPLRLSVCVTPFMTRC